MDKGIRYEVRQAGNSRRLYTDGIFHSQWNPTRLFSGHLWDLLFIPIFLHRRPELIDRALILGVGGGTLINLIGEFLGKVKIDAVDLDKNHLAIAKRFFLTKHIQPNLICQNAIDFLATETTPGSAGIAYDLVVDDLFLATERHNTSKPAEAVRPIDVNDAWLASLKGKLNPGGLVVINFESSQQLRQSLVRKRVVNQGFCQVFEFTIIRYENAIAALCTEPTDEKSFNGALNHLLERYDRASVRDLKFNLEKVI